MGFNKSYIKIENLLHVFNTQGIKGIINYIKKIDAIYSDSEITYLIVDVLNKDFCDTKKEVEINKLISKNGSKNRI